MPRERWRSRLIFIFAAVGSAAGLGNLWRFPYLTYKFGGGAFLIPYLVILLMLGFPLLLMEISLGQRLQRGALESFRMIKPHLAGIGLFAVICGFIIVSYYAVVMAWALIYFISSFTVKWAGNEESFFFNKVLGITESVGQLGDIQPFILMALVAIWIMIYFCVWGGVKSVGQVVMVTMPLPVLLVIILIIRALTLKGSLVGLSFYLTPNFAALYDIEVWNAAISQILFTLSLCFGIMIAYGSYNKDDQELSKTTIWTAMLNTSVSILAGFVVFGTLGFMASQKGVSVAEVAASGPSLAFVVFPRALAMMPLASVVSLLFFLTLLSLGIDSAFSLVEAVTTVVADAKHKTSEIVNRSWIAFYICTAALIAGLLFTTGAGLYFLDIVDHFVNHFGLVTVGMLQCVAVGWLFGAKRLRNFINQTTGIKIGAWWDFVIKIVAPLILLYFLVGQFRVDINENYEGYPSWALAIGWLVFLLPLETSLVWSFFERREKVPLLIHPYLLCFVSLALFLYSILPEYSPAIVSTLSPLQSQPTDLPATFVNDLVTPLLDPLVHSLILFPIALGVARRARWSWYCLLTLCFLNLIMNALKIVLLAPLTALADQAYLTWEVYIVIWVLLLIYLLSNRVRRFYHPSTS